MENRFGIAELNEEEKQTLQRLESKFKAETGRDMVLIAWDSHDSENIKMTQGIDEGVE